MSANWAGEIREGEVNRGAKLVKMHGRDAEVVGLKLSGRSEVTLRKGTTRAFCVGYRF